MRILIDTNVLVRLAHLGSPQQPIADRALNSLKAHQHALRLVPQVIYEFWSVVSRPADRNGLGLPVAAINTLISEWQMLFPVLRDERGILDVWQTLALQYQVQGKQAHDARLVAAMQRHGLSHILTFNNADFQRFHGIAVLDPHIVAMAQIPRASRHHHSAGSRADRCPPITKTRVNLPNLRTFFIRRLRRFSQIAHLRSVPGVSSTTKK